MTDNKAGGLLGIARRAGCLSAGHDAALGAIQNGSASLCLLASDASARLQAEMERAAARFSPNAATVRGTFTMQELGKTIGAKPTAVLTVNDAGFAARIQDYIGRE